MGQPKFPTKIRAKIRPKIRVLQILVGGRQAIPRPKLATSRTYLTPFRQRPL
ncbi:MAG: hypothetical protein ACKOFW_20060 [Planctomycetaceae bacterium]